MNKIIGMIIPYIMVVCVIIMQSVYVDNSVIALVMGLLIGIEF